MIRRILRNSSLQTRHYTANISHTRLVGQAVRRWRSGIENESLDLMKIDQSKDNLFQSNNSDACNIYIPRQNSITEIVKQSLRAPNLSLENNLKKKYSTDNLLDWLEQVSTHADSFRLSDTMIETVVSTAGVISSLDFTKPHSIRLYLQYLVTAASCYALLTSMPVVAMYGAVMDNLAYSTSANDIVDICSLMMQLKYIRVRNDILNKSKWLSFAKMLNDPDVKCDAEMMYTILDIHQLLSLKYDKFSFYGLVVDKLESFEPSQIGLLYYRLVALNSSNNGGEYVHQLQLQAEGILRDKLEENSISKMNLAELVATAVMLKSPESEAQRGKVIQAISSRKSHNVDTVYQGLSGNLEVLLDAYTSNILKWSEKLETGLTRLYVDDLTYPEGIRYLIKTLAFLRVGTIADSSGKVMLKNSTQMHTIVRKSIQRFLIPAERLQLTNEIQQYMFVEMRGKIERLSYNPIEYLRFLTWCIDNVNFNQYKNLFNNKILIDQLLSTYYYAFRDTELNEASKTLLQILKSHPHVVSESPVLALIWILDQTDAPNKHRYEVVASAIETLQKQIIAIFESIEIASKRQAYIDRLSSHLDLLATTADQHSLDARQIDATKPAELTRDAAFCVLHRVVDVIQSKWQIISRPVPQAVSSRPKQATKLQDRPPTDTPSRSRPSKATTPILGSKSKTEGGHASFLSSIREKRLYEDAIDMLADGSDKSANKNRRSWHDIKIIDDIERVELPRVVDGIDLNVDIDKLQSMKHK